VRSRLAATRLWANGQAGYYLNNSEYNFWTAIDGFASAALPVKDIEESFNKRTQILPAAGRRDNTAGTTVAQSSDGLYLANTPQSSSNEYFIYFNGASVGPINTANPASYAHGISIRCVRM
jgi:hypothetical protein